MKAKISNNDSCPDQNIKLRLKKIAIKNLDIIENYQEFICNFKPDNDDYNIVSKMLNDAKKIESVLTRTYKLITFIEKDSNTEINQTLKQKKSNFVKLETQNINDNLTGNEKIHEKIIINDNSHKNNEIFEENIINADIPDIIVIPEDTIINDNLGDNQRVWGEIIINDNLYKNNEIFERITENCENNQDNLAEFINDNEVESHNNSSCKNENALTVNHLREELFKEINLKFKNSEDKINTELAAKLITPSEARKLLKKSINEMYEAKRAIRRPERRGENIWGNI